MASLQHRGAIVALLRIESQAVTLGAAAPAMPSLPLRSPCYIFIITGEAASVLSARAAAPAVSRASKHLLLNHETFMKSQIVPFPWRHACANKQVHYHTRLQREMENKLFYRRVNTAAEFQHGYLCCLRTYISCGKGSIASLHIASSECAGTNDNPPPDNKHKYTAYSH